MADPATTGITAAAKVVQGVDPLAITQIPNWVWMVGFTVGMAASYLVAWSLHLVKLAISRAKPGDSAGSETGGCNITTGVHTECQNNWQEQIRELKAYIKEVDNNGKATDKRLWSLLLGEVVKQKHGHHEQHGHHEHHHANKSDHT